jgi:CheY-like chemotaxis protein
MFADMSVLVVEDDARSLLSITRLLKGLGLRFKRNTTGAHVVEQVNLMRPSLVLLNVDLPDGDPYEICDHIRQNPATADTPIVAMGDNVDHIHGCSRCGDRMCFFALVRKPLSQKELIGILNCLVAGSSASV